MIYFYPNLHIIVIRGGVEDTRLEAKDTKKNPRPRTDTLEAKDRNTRGQDQGHKRKCSPKKKRSSQKFFKRSLQKNVFQKIFQALHKILTIQKILLSSSRGQANLEDLRPRGQGHGLQNLSSRTSSRPRTSSRTLPLIVIAFCCCCILMSRLWLNFMTCSN